MSDSRDIRNEFDGGKDVTSMNDLLTVAAARTFNELEISLYEQHADRLDDLLRRVEALRNGEAA